VTQKARHKKREKKIVEEDEKKAVDERVDEERVDEERGAASEPLKSAKEHAYEIRHRGVVGADMSTALGRSRRPQRPYR